MRIVVTRTEPGCSRLCARLRREGWAATARPVLEIVAIEERAQIGLVTDLDRFALRIFVSAHAAMHGMTLIDRYWPTLPLGGTWIAVGDATRRALADWGVDALAPADATSEGLLSLAAVERAGGTRALLVCGRGGRDLIERSLAGAGMHVARLEVYERRPLSEGAEIDPAAFDAAVIASGDGLDAFHRLRRQHGGGDDLLLVVPSERIAGLAAALGYAHVLRSDGAGEDAVVARLRAFETRE